MKVRNCLKRRPALLLDLAPRRTSSIGGNPPDRVYSDAAGLGTFASYNSLENGGVGRSILMTGCAGGQLE